MTVDLRAAIACDLGPIISGSVGSNHISDRSGLEMLSGRLTLDGLYSPARGTAINLLVACPQLGRVTRFPKVLRVIRSTSYPLDNRTEVEVGCKLTLLKELKQQDQYFPGSGAISAQAVLTYCLSQLGITMAAGSPNLAHQLLRSSIDLSGGYVRVIGDLIRSECAFGRLRPDETFEVVPINLAIGGTGPVLTADDLVSFEPITTGSEPPDQYRVTYSAAERGSGAAGTTQQEQQQADDFWRLNEKYSDPEKVYIFYTDLNGTEKQYTFYNRTYSSSESWYEVFSYRDASGKQQKAEVMTRKVDRKRATAASLNGSYLGELLRYGFMSSALLNQAETIDDTFYSYKSTPDGPVKSREETIHYASELEFAGNLSIPSYIGWGGTGYQVAYAPGLDLMPTTRTLIEYDTFTETSGRVVSRTFTSRWIARALTQQGQHEFSASVKSQFSTNVGAVANAVAAFSGLSFEGTEVQAEAAKPAIATRPSAQERRAQVVNAAGDASTQRTITGTVLFTAGQPSNSITTTATYDMPFTPDDISAAGTAITAAHRFGQTEAALDVGHAYGYNIVTSFDRIPTLHMAPLYVRLAGLEAAFLTDSLSYAFDASGLVVSSDLMLLGTTGYYGASPPISSWVRLPVPVAGLQAAGAATTEASPAKANSISYPNGFDPTNPAAAFAALGNTGTDVFAAWKAGQHLIGPTVALDAEALATGPAVDAIDYAYALDAGTDVASLATGPVSEFAWVTTIAAPAAGISVAGLVPRVAISATVIVPAAAVAVTGQAPAVSSGASVAVPAAGVAVAAVAPDLVGRQKTIINVPAAAVAVAGQVPAGIGAYDPNFSSVTMLLHFDGSNNSTTFTDSSAAPLTLTANGNAKISTTQSKFGGASGYFDGSGDYLSAAYSSGIDLLGGNFTVECWLYVSAFQTNFTRVMGTGGGAVAWNTTNGLHWILSIIGGNKLSFEIKNSSGNATVTTTAAISQATWTHVCVSVSGSTAYVGIDGTVVSGSIGTVSRPSTNPTFNLATLPGEAATNNGFNGYIDDLRIKKTALYTANYTVPSQPFPNR